MSSSRALDLVVLSFLRRFLKATITFASEMSEKLGGWKTYDNLDADFEKPPKPLPAPRPPNVSLGAMIRG